MRIQYYPSDSSDDNDFNFSFLFTGHSPNWDASWISDSNTKPRSTSSPACISTRNWARVKNKPGASASTREGRQRQKFPRGTRLGSGLSTKCQRFEVCGKERALSRH